MTKEKFNFQVSTILHYSMTNQADIKSGVIPSDEFVFRKFTENSQ